MYHPTEDKDMSMAFEKMPITSTIFHDDVNNSHSLFQEKIIQGIDRLKEVSHKRSDIHSISDFINKSTASNLTKESLEEIITNLVNKNFIINKKWKVQDSFRRNVAIVNSIIADTQHEDTADLNTVKSNIKT